MVNRDKVWTLSWAFFFVAIVIWAYAFFDMPDGKIRNMVIWVDIVIFLVNIFLSLMYLGWELMEKVMEK